MNDEEKKSKNRERMKRYYHEHIEERRAYSRAYDAEHREKKRDYARMYRAENPEKVKQSKREYYYQNRESILEKMRASHNPEVSAERSRKYRDKLGAEFNRRRREKYAENPEEAQDKSRRYRSENPDKVKRWYKNAYWNHRAKKIAGNYRCYDEKKFGACDTITGEWIEEHIFSSSCIYCGDSDRRHLGADRIDNSKPHTPDNVVCACGICNAERGDKFTVEEFIEYRKTHPRFAKKTAYEVTDTGALKKKQVPGT